MGTQYQARPCGEQKLIKCSRPCAVACYTTSPHSQSIGAQQLIVYIG